MRVKGRVRVRVGFGMLHAYIIDYVIIEILCHEKKLNCFDGSLNTLDYSLSKLCNNSVLIQQVKFFFNFKIFLNVSM